MSIIELYSRMLDSQATLQFPFESFFFSHQAWQSAATVIDFGCGNGAYLDMLAREFPNRRYYGVEANPAMLSVARSRPHAPNIAFVGSLGEITESRIDFALMRYVVMHLSDRDAVFREIGGKLSHDAAMLVIEPDDKRIQIYPPFALLEEAVTRIKQASHDRDVMRGLDGEMDRIGFALLDEASCVVSSRIELVEKNLLNYVLSLIEIGFEDRLSSDHKAELLDWYLDPRRFVQFGFYGRLYGAIGNRSSV